MEKKNWTTNVYSLTFLYGQKPPQPTINMLPFTHENCLNVNRRPSVNYAK